jgi:hypothetical protein
VIFGAEMTLRNGHRGRSAGGKAGEAQSSDPEPTARGVCKRASGPHPKERPAVVPYRRFAPSHHAKVRFFCKMGIT